MERGGGPPVPAGEFLEKGAFQKEENIWFALTLIVITETALYIGANIIKFFHIKIRENNTRSSDSIFCKAEFVINLRKV